MIPHGIHPPPSFCPRFKPTLLFAESGRIIGYAPDQGMQRSVSHQVAMSQPVAHIASEFQPIAQRPAGKCNSGIFRDTIDDSKAVQPPVLGSGSLSAMASAIDGPNTIAAEEQRALGLKFLSGLRHKIQLAIPESCRIRDQASVSEALGYRRSVSMARDSAPSRENPCRPLPGGGMQATIEGGARGARAQSTIIDRYDHALRLARGLREQGARVARNCAAQRRAHGRVWGRPGRREVQRTHFIVTYYGELAPWKRLLLHAL